MATAPYGFRLLVGAATMAVEETIRLPKTILMYPMTLASTAAHIVMRFQQNVAELVIKGDATLNHDPKKGKVVAPILLWGPYLWADGIKPRKADGLVWERKDFTKDGVHPTREDGARKVATIDKSLPVAQDQPIPLFDPATSGWCPDDFVHARPTFPAQ